MTKKAISILVIIFIILVIQSLYAQNSLKHDSTITKIIKLNEFFKLDFRTCPSCGYTWIMNNLYDSTQLKLIGITSWNEKNHIQLKGGTDVFIWEFQGLKKGAYRLFFVYKKPWLEEIEDKRTYNIIVE
ncbi:MAG: protease inhibitor I42 family protein [Bacteroidales bacterium]